MSMSNILITAAPEVWDIMPRVLQHWFADDFHCEDIDTYNGHIVGWVWKMSFHPWGVETTMECVVDFNPAEAQKWIQDMMELYIAITLEDAKDIPEISEIIEDEIEEDIHAQEWAEELAWYNHARMMGWE